MEKYEVCCLFSFDYFILLLLLALIFFFFLVWLLFVSHSSIAWDFNKGDWDEVHK